MNSETLGPTFTLTNQNQEKSFYLNYWQVAMTAILTLIVAGYILSMLNGTATLILGAAIVLVLAMKPVFDILNADYNISLENLELKNIHEELWD